MAYVTKGKSTAQTAVIYDALSEGPIEGLVNNAASIRLDGNPVIADTASVTFSPQRTVDSSYTASTKILVDNNSPSIFEYALTTDGTREIQILGGKKKGINAADTIAGNNIIRTDTSIMTFASDDVYDASVNFTPAYLRIDGAGPNGTQLSTKITEFINTSAVRVDLAPAQTKSNTSLYLDLVDTIASYDSSNNRATLTTGGGVDTANTISILSSPVRTTSDVPKYNYNNFGFAFRTGERDQSYLPTPAGIGSASQATAFSDGLAQVQNTGYPSNSAFGLDEPKTNATANEVIKTSAQMSIGNPSEVDAVKINMVFPSGLFSQKENGKLDYGFAEHRIYFGYSRDGGSTYTDALVVGRPTISTSITRYHKNTCTKDSTAGIIRDKTKEGFNYTYLINTEEFQPYDAYRIKIQRLSPVNQKENKWQQGNGSQLKSIENIITDKLRYPYTAYAGVIVDAEDFSQIPKRGYEIFGMKVKVPTNYFPREEHTAAGVRRSVATYTRNVLTGADTGTYQDWDGNFRGDEKEFDNLSNSTDLVNNEPVYTDNPVWIFMDMLTNPRYGLGSYLDIDGDLSKIDKWTMYQIAKYCDELVPDGKGGSEPRFTCNTYISKGQDALKTLKQFATVIRSMLIWYNGEVTLGSNIQKGAVYTFNKSNVAGGEFAYSGTAGRFKHNQIRVAWNDPEDSYKQAIEVVEDIDEIQKSGKIRRKTVTAFGCTSQGQAHRYGKWHLFTERLEREVLSFKTGINAGAVLRPGDVINVQDADRDGVQLSGRITTSSASTTTVIKTDRDLSSTLNANNNYKLHLIYPSGGAYLTQEVATINSVVYRQGDLVLIDESGGSIDNEEKARNVRDDAGALVQLHWSEDVRIETQDVASFNATSITVSSAFSSVPNGEVVYAISGETDKGVDVEGTIKQYVVTSIKENQQDMTFDISAAEYDIKKFDAVDRGYEIPTLPSQLRKPKRSEEVPTPQNLTATVVPSGGNQSSIGSGIAGYDIVMTWTHPTSTRTDSDGNTLTDVYEHLAGYRIQHNAQTEAQDLNHDEFVKIDVDKQTSYTIRDVTVGDEYIVRCQTRNTNGQTSSYIQTKIDFNVSSLAPFSAELIPAGLNGSIVRGGLLTAIQNINSSNGTVTFSNNTYSYQPLNGADALAFASANTNFTTQAGFNNLADGETGYLLFDYDANLARGTTRTDPLQAIHLHTDDTATDIGGNKLNYTFMKRLGESNNDIVQATGTITLAAGSSTITGSGTAFTTDFIPGDVVIVDVAGATRFYSTVSYIESNTSMNISSAPSRAYSGKNIFRQALRIDSSSDAVLAEVSNNSGTFTITSFTNKVTIDNDDEVAANSITGVHIVSDGISSTHISANSIGAAAIVADAIDSSHIAANSIGSASIIAGSITSNEIAANSIGSAAISANAIGISEISANSIGGVAISANAITNSEIAANSIDTIAIAANSITAAQLTSDAVGSFTVTANSITAVELSSNSVGSSQIAANSIASVEIKANSIGSSEISANAVNGTIIAGNSVGGTQISANSVNGIILSSGAVDAAAKLANNVISAAKILSGAVDTDQLATDAITAAKIAANAVGEDAIAANAIGSSEVKSNSIGAVNIVAGAIGASEIAANSIGSTAIVAGAIGQSEISANSITTNMIVSDAIDNSHISANSIDSNMIVAGTIDSSHIGANSITAAAVVAGSITNSEIAGNTINSAVIQAGAVTNPQIGANAITSAKIKAGNVDTAEIASGAVTNAKIGANAINAAKIAAGTITNAEISSSAGIGFAKISVANGDIDFAKISVGNGNITNAMIGTGVDGSKLTGTITNATIAANAIDSAQIKSGSIDTVHIAANQITTAKIASGNITNATITANAITNAKISSTDSMTLTVAGGSAGGWALTGSTFSSTNASGGSNGAFATGGITLGSSGFISAKEFYIDTSGNAKFKGALEGDDITVNGTLVLPSTGANVSGVSIGSWSTNVMDNKHITSIGSGPGFYQGFVRVTGGTHYVKTVSIQIRTGTSTTSEGTLIYETPQLHQYTAGNLLSNGGTRLFTNTSPVASGNMPIAFTYTGSGNVSAFVRAQADSGPDRLGIGEARFIKFGTTDPVFTFANQTGVALSTAFYSNTQVVGGFAGTKTVNITNTSFTRFSIDGGAFGTANAQIANGSYINVELTSASSNLTTRSTNVTIGEKLEIFQVTTGGTGGGGGGGGGGGFDDGDDDGGEEEEASFVQGTPVVMSDGTTKAIEDIAVGDVVKSFRHSSLDASDNNAWKTWATPEIGNGSFGTSTVTAITGRRNATEYYWLNYNLKVTGNHPMVVFKDNVFKFVRAENLIVGDRIVNEDGTLEEVFSNGKVTVNCLTYNFDVEADDTYIVRGGNDTGYIVHNKEIE